MSTKSTTEPEKGIVGVGGDNRAWRDGKKFDGSEINDGKVNSGKIDNQIGKKGQKTFKSKKTVRSDFFTLGSRLAFTKLR